MEHAATDGNLADSGKFTETSDRRSRPFAASEPTHIVGIGASAGGLEALERLFQNMPDDTGMAFVVVQHLSPDFKSLMDELLARWTRMPIHAVEDRMPVVANEIFLMPPKTEVIISDGKLLLTAREPSDELRLPIDQFFRSLARDAGKRAVAIVLSGTGSDGSRGIQEVHQAGGFVVVQSEETAKFDGMPKSAIETGMVDVILPPGEIPGELLRQIHHPQAAAAPEDDRDGMTPVFRLLREAYGIDFSYYKPTTVTRRTERRLQLGRVSSLEDYADQLRDNREELDSLYRDLLIGVTSFFRDSAAFQVLEEKVIPDLLARVPEGNDFRAWVAGCATGEEAYSLAILIRQCILKSGKQVNAKIFATDAHSRSLEFAATGLYSEDSVASVTAQRLKDYFVRTNEGFRVSPELRNMVVFAPHNIIKDAPFTRLDLISCRNLLIYLVPPAQKKALSLFHFGLKTGGVLFLGPSESPGDLSSEFDSLDKHWRIFRKRRDAKLPADLRLPMSLGLSASLSPLAAKPGPQRITGLGEVFQQLLDQTLPPSVLVNEHLEIVHTFGDAARFLKLRKGMPSLGLLDMLSDELRMAVGAALHRAAREKQPVSFGNVQTSAGGNQLAVNLTALPLESSRRIGSHMLIRFDEVEPPKPQQQHHKHTDLAEATRDHVAALEAELRFAKENLQATIEELETSNEELQATNEELLASNEELQSTNEELHSVNEELYTVNAEYQKKIQEQTELTQDMNNLLESTDVHTIFLDEQLCIRKFTPKMAAVFNLIASDVGRSIHGFVHTIDCQDLPDKLALVLASGEPHEEEVRNADGAHFLMRILPYQGDVERSGVVMTLIDVTVVKLAESQFNNAVEVSPNGMLMVDAAGQITRVNSEIERMFGYTRSELVGRPLHLLMPPEQGSRHAKLQQEYFRKPHSIRRMGPDSYVWGLCKDGRRIPLDVRVDPITTPSGLQAIACLVDISQHQELETSLRDQVRQRDRFLATLSHELRNPMAAILTAASLLDRLAEESSDVQQPSGVIRRQASQIATLLDDLLDVSRVTQGKIKLRREVIDIVEVCRESIEAVSPLADAHQHQVTFEASQQCVWVDVDRVRILQSIENLLTNACKYTPDRGKIRIDVCSSEAEAIVRVRDNGCGMSPELLTSVFDMFVQSDETLDRSEGGMGVGLTLVRSLVELHQGSIDAFSDGPGKGSEFVIRLPLTDKRPAQREESKDLEIEENPRIVLVEDNQDAREMLESLLHRDGFQVVATASDGAEGFDVIMQHKPSVALLDIGLPQIDGYQLARKIRAELGQEVRLIALTGYGRDEDREAVIEAGFNDHVVKPITLQQLRQILKVKPR